MNRHEILQEMGLGPVWVRRDLPLEPTIVEVRAEAPINRVLAPAVPGYEAAVRQVAAAPVPENCEPDAVVQVEADVIEMTSAIPPNAGIEALTQRAAAIAAMDWPELIDSIRGCTACGLCRTRTHAVPGVGDLQGDWLIVGEGPGADEDKKGEPFVGRAGQLLDNMLAALGLKRGQGVYIANVIKCRPPENRDPDADEIAACRPYLNRQIQLLQPKIMLAVGRHAGNTLLESDAKVGQMRGSVHAINGIPLVVTYHPAYLLRSPGEKGKAWQDLLLARKAKGSG